MPSSPRPSLKPALLVALTLLAAAWPGAGEIVPVSIAIDPSAEPGPGSELASLSTDGRYVAFFSPASNLVADDTNGFMDSFVYDTSTQTVTRVSVDSTGAQANGPSDECAISGDGRYAAFASWATNLVTGDTSTTKDIFVHDLQTGETTQVSVASDGTQSDDRSLAPSISASGRYVAFASLATNLVADDTNWNWDVFVHDRDSGTTVRASVSTAGAQTSGQTYQAKLSADGRHVAFISDAADLVEGDTNGQQDVFLRDLDAGTTVRASVANDEAQASGSSSSPDLSSDGRYVAFASWASNLIPPAADTNGAADVFVRDLVAGTTERDSVGIGSVGGQGPYDSDYPAISDDGRYVAFQSAWDFAGGHPEYPTGIFVRDRVGGTTVEASLTTEETEGAGTQTGQAAISGDGNRVAFHSNERFLVPGDTNDGLDVFVRDLAAGTLERCPDTAAPSPPGAVALGDGPSGVSDTGGWDDTPIAMAENRIAFASHAANLVADDTNDRVDVFVHNLESGTTTRASLSDTEQEADADCFNPALAVNGRFVAFESEAGNLVAGDANGAHDVFVRDLEAGTTEIVSLSNGGAQPYADSDSPAISADGRYVAFVSASDGLVANDSNGQQDVFVRDRQLGTTVLVSATPGGVSGNITSWSPAITPDGRWVAFLTYARNLVAGDPDHNAGADVFLRDLESGVTIRASADAPTTADYGQASAPALSADGRYVAFHSDGAWLVPGDTNTLYDVFVFDRVTGLTERVSVHSSGAESHGYARYPALSADGRFVAFSSNAHDLVDPPGSNPGNVYVHDRSNHTTRVLSVWGPTGASEWSGSPAISSEGLRVAYVSADWSQVTGDTNSLPDIFRWTEAVIVDTFEDETLCSWDVVVGGPPCP